MNLDGLYKFAEDNEIYIDDFPLHELKACSIPHAIAINSQKVKTERETREVLAHELGHHMRNAFYNISSTYETRSRQEERAIRWAVQMLIPADEIKKLAN